MNDVDVLTFFRPGFIEARPLLAIFHDPPGIMNKTDPFDGRPEFHNTWLVSTKYNPVPNIH